MRNKTNDIMPNQAIESQQPQQLYPQHGQNIENIVQYNPIQYQSDNKQQMNQYSENLSFCGCGFLGIYHIGVSSCILQHAPHISTHKIAGSSVGALVAVAHICGNLQLGTCLSEILQIAIKARAGAFGPFNPSFNISELIYKGLQNGLPNDIHKRASGVLHVSLTRVEDGANVIINEFHSKEELIQVLICSCFVPFFSGFVPSKYRGVSYMDGGFSNNLLKLDESTVSVSPFAGEADICPIDDYLHLLQISLCNTSFSISPDNAYRVINSLLPPPPETLSKLYDQGFNDALRYLIERKHISRFQCKISSSQADSSIEASPSQDTALCGSPFSELNMIDALSLDEEFGHLKCSSSHKSNFIMMLSPNKNNNDDNNYNDYDDFIERGKTFVYDPIPDIFTQIIREKFDQVNKNLSNWFFANGPIKDSSWMAGPCLRSLDASVLMVRRIWQNIPSISKELLRSLHELLSFLQSLVLKKKGKLEVIEGRKRFDSFSDNSKFDNGNLCPL